MLPKQQSFALAHHLLLFFILFLHNFVFSHQQVCNHHDQASLLAFALNISTSSSTPLNWSSTTSCCEWEEIECNNNGKVTHLQLSSRGIKCTITSSISNLVKLVYLNLSNNHINRFQLEGISALTHLKTIDLSSNSISGSILQETSKLGNLEKLHLYNNNLRGHIPPSLMNCVKLVEIILRDNHLDGDISKLNFSSLVQLEKLDLRNNSFYGTFPESIYSCKSLVAIRVSLNNMTGQISPKIVGLKSLSFISLSQNSFTNVAATLRALAKCSNLTSLLLSVNFYGEHLPVHRTFISFNEFPKLQFFGLGSCGFGGSIPEWLSSLRSLRVLNLSGNKMIGRIPDWLGDLPNLSRLILANNNLSGAFPTKLCQLPALISETIDGNFKYFHFELPVFNLDTGNTTYNQFNDFYQGISLSYNKLNGMIPTEIGQLQSLQILDLSNNHFSSNIPASISNLKNLEVLNLARNNFTGEIPASFEGLHFLSHFNVAYNNLEGPIPRVGQFDTFESSSFEGNSGLCGEPLNHPCFVMKPEEVDSNRSQHKMLQFLHGLYVGFASGFSGVLIIAVSCYVWFKHCKGSC